MDGGNFDQFLKQFYAYDNWYVQNHFKGSFFDNNKNLFFNYYIHADIIKFDGKCMILDPISWLRFVFWRDKKWKEMSKKVIW
jgi:hypothetical protein